MASRHFHALAVDYDGTIAHDGRVSTETLDALQRLKDSGRKLLLVTGRERSDLDAIFPDHRMFDLLVLENGGVIIRPGTNEYETIGKSPPSDFVRILKEKGVPMSLGHVILATWEPHEQIVLETIKELGLDLQVIFNKGAVMVLPSGVTKGSGLRHALSMIGISPLNTIGIGDAENDHAFLSICGCSVAVANALPKIKERVDIVTKGDHGEGVQELVEAVLADDLLSRADRLQRHSVRIGKTADGERYGIPPSGANILISGTSGGGKSTLITGLMERFIEHGMQFCIIDPEGDHSSFSEAMVLGSPKRPPSIEEVLQFFQNIERSAIVDLLGQQLQERPSFFLSLLPRLLEHKEKTGRPHWIIVDEAHHMLPGPWDFASQPFPKELDRMMYVTLLPGNLPDVVLKTIDIVIAVGKEPQRIVEDFCTVIGETVPTYDVPTLERGEAMVWMRTEGRPPVKVSLPENRTVHKRHSRKYAEGELNEERSFYFRGPDATFNLRAQNVFLFLQIAEGVDEETLKYHLYNGDYAAWFEKPVKNSGIAQKIREVEKEKELTREEILKRLRALIEEEYTKPAGA